MKTLNISGIRLGLPETMSAKDVQALIGFLATLQLIDSHYDYTANDYLHCLGRYPEIRLEVIPLDPDARAKSEASHAAYVAKRDAERAATAT